MRKGPHGPVMQADLDSISVEMVRRKGLTAGGWMGGVGGTPRLILFLGLRV